MRVLMLHFVVLLSACGPLDLPWCKDESPLPELKTCAGCAPTVRSRLRQPEGGLDIAFVAEGYPVEQLDDFDRLTRGWLTDFEREVGSQVPGLVPQLNAWWIDFRELAAPDGLVLGSCLQRNGDYRGVGIDINHERLNALVTPPGVDVIVVVLNSSTRFRETGMHPWSSVRPVVMTNSFTPSGTFAHELGHSLFGLGDEYSTTPGAPSAASAFAFSSNDLRVDDLSVFLVPNLSVEARSPKFGGATEGLPGGATFERGLFHHGAACLMNQSEGALCPICQRAAQARVDRPLTNPRCGLRVAEGPTGGLLATIVAFDWDGLSEVRVRGRTSRTLQFGDRWGVTMSLPIDQEPGFPVEATCVDQRGQSSSVWLDL